MRAVQSLALFACMLFIGAALGPAAFVGFARAAEPSQIPPGAIHATANVTATNESLNGSAHVNVSIPLDNATSRLPNGTLIEHNVSNMTKDQLAEVLNLTRSLLPPELPPLQEALNISNVTRNIPDVVDLANRTIDSVNNVTENVTDIVENLTTTVTNLTDELLGEPGPVLPALPVTLPPPADSVQYTICFRTPTTPMQCSQSGIVGIPTLIDLSGDGNADITITATLCGLGCFLANIDQMPALAANMQAEVLVLYDTDGSTTDNQKSVVVFGYDTIGRTNYPTKFDATANTFSGDGCSSSYHVTLAVDGDAGTTLRGQYQKYSGSSLTEVQDLRWTWETAPPATADVSIAMGHCGGATTDIGYDAASAVKVGAVYTHILTASDLVDQVSVTVDQLPSQWDVTSSWSTDGAEAHHYTANAAISAVDFQRVQQESGILRNIVDAHLRTLPRDITVSKSACAMSFAGADQNGSPSAIGLVEFQSSNRGLYGFSDPHYAIFITTPSDNLLAVRVEGIRSASASMACQSNQGYSNFQYSLSNHLPSFLVVFEWRSGSQDAIAQAVITTLPSTANLRWTNRKFTLSGTSRAFDVIDTCYTTSGTCFQFTGNDMAFVYERDGLNSMTARISGLRTATLGVNGNNWEVTSTLEPGGQPFEFLYDVGNNNFYGVISSLPSSESLTADLSNPNGVTARFVNDDAISQVYAAGMLGGNGVLFDIQGIGASNTMQLTANLPTQFAFSSTNAISVVNACYTPTFNCPYYGGNFVVIVPDEYVVAYIGGLKSADVNFANSQVHAAAQVTSGGDFYAEFVGSVTYRALVCSMPTSWSLDYNAASSTKTMNYNGNAQTPCIVAEGPDFYAVAEGVPAQVGLTWTLDSATPSAAYTASSTVDSIYVTANLATTSRPWRSLTACVEDLNPLTLSWSSDMSSLSFSSSGGIGRVRAYLAPWYNNACPAAQWDDYAIISEHTDIVVAQVTGLQTAAFTMNNAGLSASATLTESGVRSFTAYWENSHEFAYGYINALPGSMSLTSNLATRATWTADIEVAEVDVQARIGLKDIYVKLTGVPTSVDVLYDAGNKQAKFVVPAGQKLTTATAWFHEWYATPATIYAFAAAVPSVTMSWGTDYKNGVVTVSGEVGYLDFAIDNNGNGYAIPDTEGLYIVKDGWADYVGIHMVGLRGASWDMRNGLTATLDSSGGNGWETLQVLYYSLANDCVWAYARVNWLPTGSLSVTTDLKTQFGLTTPARLSEVYVTGDACGLTFYTDLFDVGSLAYNVGSDAAGTFTPQDSNGIRDGVLYLANPNPEGIAGSGLHHVLVHVWDAPSTLRFSLGGNKMSASFDNGYLGQGFLWLSKNDCMWGWSGDYVVWNTECGERSVDGCGNTVTGTDSVVVNIGGFRGFEFEKTVTQSGCNPPTRENIYAEVNTEYGRPFTFVRFSYRPNTWEEQFTWASISNLPTTMSFGYLKEGSKGYFDYVASNAISAVEVFTTEFKDSHFELSLSSVPDTVSAEWQFGNPGYVLAHSSDPVQAYLLGRIGEGASQWWVGARAAFGEVWDASGDLYSTWGGDLWGGYFNVDTEGHWITGAVAAMHTTWYVPDFLVLSSGAVWAEDFGISWWPPTTYGNLYIGGFICGLTYLGAVCFNGSYWQWANINWPI